MDGEESKNNLFLKASFPLFTGTHTVPLQLAGKLSSFQSLEVLPKASLPAGERQQNIYLLPQEIALLRSTEMWSNHLTPYPCFSDSSVLTVTLIPTAAVFKNTVYSYVVYSSIIKIAQDFRNTDEWLHILIFVYMSTISLWWYFGWNTFLFQQWLSILSKIWIN